MPWFLRLLLWFAIMVVLTMVAGSIPKSEPQFHIFIGLCLLVWCLMSVAFVIRGIWRVVFK